MFKSVHGFALFTLFVLGSPVEAGQPTVRPLWMLSEREARETPIYSAVAGDQDQERAFYYSQGKKIFLGDTGLAVVKLKDSEGASTGKEMSILSATVTANNPLADLMPTLERSGMVLINTAGPQSFDLRAASADQMERIAYVMPVVQTIRGSRGAGAESSAAMIMTPRVVAKFAKSLDETRIRSLVSTAGLKVVRRQRHVPNGYILTPSEPVPNYSGVLRAANRLYESGKADGTVLYSHPDFVPTKTRHNVPTKTRHNAPYPSDPLFPEQWHLENTGQDGGKPDADVRAREAWAMTMGSPEVVIAIIDDSVEKNHPDLRDNFVSGRFYNGLTGDFEDDPSPRTTDEKHGTSCAGVAVAARNSVGGLGAAPGCGLVGVHFWSASVAQTADAFYFCDDEGASVISCSWSWGGAFDAVSSAIRDLFVNGRGGKGSIILFAAGNEGGRIDVNQRFGTLDEVICVGATNWRDDHSPYSNHGPELSVVAPSSDRYWIRPESLGIATTDNTESSPSAGGFSGYAAGDYTPNRGEPSFGGTSSATPLVAGICGLLLSVDRDLTAKEVREVLESTADKIPGELRVANYGGDGHDPYYGHGRVNAKKALESVFDGTEPEIVQLPVVVLTDGEIATPGESDWYHFYADAMSESEYTIETKGGTDVLISLYGPSDQSVLLATDDDSGEGRNSRIIAQLDPGEYFVQVRHYSKTKVGAYNIQVVARSTGAAGPLSMR